MSYEPAFAFNDEVTSAYYSDYKSGKSLFALSYKYTVNSPLLWTFFAYLLTFMILVDTGQRIALRLAGDDRCWVMFVNRCISELMMFGAVAISILMIDEGVRKTLPYMVRARPLERTHPSQFPPFTHSRAHASGACTSSTRTRFTGQMCFAPSPPAYSS